MDAKTVEDAKHLSRSYALPEARSNDEPPFLDAAYCGQAAIIAKRRQTMRLVPDPKLNRETRSGSVSLL